MINNNKGFTLIELLAVIVILAIIMLIATPLIVNVINDARKGAFRNSAYGIVKSAEIQYTSMLIKENSKKLQFTYSDGVEASIPEGYALDYKGSKPKSGKVMVNTDGKVAIALHNGKWCAEKNYDDNIIVLTDKTSDDCVIPTPNEPTLSIGMIPIIWNGKNWIKADINTNWYDYDEKKWANVVLTTESSRSLYKEASPGTIIQNDDVMAYLVWIPRYKYKLFNVESIESNPQEIEIVFEKKTTSKSNGNTNGAYLTHPAFTFGDKELDGFWVGKFETTGSISTPTIKPNITSLRGLNVSTHFTTAQKFNNAAIYGVENSFDAHMIKNLEWGAISYLSHSKYGKNNEIWINPSGDFITGCAGESVSAETTNGCPNQYHTANGLKASTTGNIYGVYDMSGGAYDLVMASMFDSNNTTLLVAESGFDQATIDSAYMNKYIDKYTYGTADYNDPDAYNRRKLGDATGETRGWYNDMNSFAIPTKPWFYRGGGDYHGVSAGAYLYSTLVGRNIGNATSRLIIS